MTFSYRKKLDTLATNKINGWKKMSANFFEHEFLENCQSSSLLVSKYFSLLYCWTSEFDSASSKLPETAMQHIDFIINKDLNGEDQVLGKGARTVYLGKAKDTTVAILHSLLRNNRPNFLVITGATAQADYDKEIEMLANLVHPHVVQTLGIVHIRLSYSVII